MRRLFALLMLATALFAVGVAAAQDDAPPFIGIGFSPDGASGVVVTQVVEGSPAADAGLQTGDVIVTLDDAIVTAQNLGELVAEYSVGDEVTLTVIREGDVQEIDLTLGERPQEVAAAMPTIPERLATLEVPEPSTRLGVAVDVTEDDSGAAVINVVDPSPAARAGIAVGDVITAVDGEPVENPTQLIDVISSYAPGDTVEVTVLRNGDEETIDVELGVRPVEISMGDEPPAQNPLMRVPEVTGITFNPEDTTWTVDSDELGEFNLEQGDIITEVQGEPVENPQQLFDLLGSAMTEGSLPVTVIRDGEAVEIEVPADVIVAMLATFQP